VRAPELLQKERTRIDQDIHDTIGADLTHLMITVEKEVKPQTIKDTIGIVISYR